MSKNLWLYVYLFTFQAIQSKVSFTNAYALILLANPDASRLATMRGFPDALPINNQQVKSQDQIIARILSKHSKVDILTLYQKEFFANESDTESDS